MNAADGSRRRGILMACLEVRFESRYLQGYTSVSVILPGYDALRNTGEIADVYQKNRKLKTLYLLHGACQDHTSWMRGSKIEEYATKHNLAVVMPMAYNTCYTNMVYGMEYYSYLSEELPAAMEAMFPLSDKKEDRFVAGLSMGGRGAFLWAMKRPDFFAGSASLSGSLNLNILFEQMKMNESGIRRYTSVFGDLSKLKDSEHDIYWLAKKLVESGAEMPRFLIGCGTEDIRYETQHKPFIEYAQQIGLPLESMEGPGDHEFKYWDPAVKQAIEWFLK